MSFGRVPANASVVVADTVDPDSIAGEVESNLDEAERRLLALVQEGARGTTELGDVLLGLQQIVALIGQTYARLQDAQGRRDVGFQTTARLEAVRKHALWLYRKARLEECFFTKLRLERGLRDAIYRQIVETYQEMAGLDDAERDLRAQPDVDLAQELLKHANGAPPESALR